MVDGIDANRRKWQELCSSCQQTHKVSVFSQSAESDQSPESHDNAERNEHPQLNPVENSKLGSKSKCGQGLKCNVNKDFCDNQPASAGNTTVAGQK